MDSESDSGFSLPITKASLIKNILQIIRILKELIDWKNQQSKSHLVILIFYKRKILFM